jgi:hypothetical protein
MPRFFAVAMLVLGGLLFLRTPAAAAVLDASWLAPTTNDDGSRLTDLASYRVYYASTTTSPCSGSAFFQVASSTASPSAGQRVNFRLTGLTANSRYYVAISAVDTRGGESDCSPTVNAVAQAAFTVSPTGSVDFGSVNLGSVLTRTYTVTSTRAQTLTGTVSTSAPFSIVSGSSFTLVGAGATHTVTVRFAPTALVTTTVNLTFSASGDTVSRLLTGTGTGTAPSPGSETVRPTVAITSPTSSSTYSTTASSLTLAGTAADNVGVTQVRWANSLGGSGTATGTTSWTASGVALQTGTNVLTITARDAAGNTATDTLTVTRGTTTSSALTITSPTSNGTYSTKETSLTLRGTVSSNAGVTQVRWANDRGGSGTASGTTSWTASGIALQVGTNVLTVTGRTASGSTLTDRVTVTRFIPRPPTITITSPTTSSTYRTSTSVLTLRGTAADNIRVTQVRWANNRGGSGTATGTTSWTASIRLQLGTNVLTVTAFDDPGSTGTDTLTVVLE